MLSDEQITKFQMLYRNRFGKEISREEAIRQGVKLVRFVKLICSPINSSESKKLTKLELTKNNYGATPRLSPPR